MDTHAGKLNEKQSGDHLIRSINKYIKMKQPKPLMCGSLTRRPPTSSQIMTRRLNISYECLVLSYACLTSSYNLNICFYSSTFCLRAFYLSFCMSYSVSGWLAPAWLPQASPSLFSYIFALLGEVACLFLAAQNQNNHTETILFAVLFGQ